MIHCISKLFCVQ